MLAIQMRRAQSHTMLLMSHNFLHCSRHSAYPNYKIYACKLLMHISTNLKKKKKKELATRQTLQVKLSPSYICISLQHLACPGLNHPDLHVQRRPTVTPMSMSSAAQSWWTMFNGHAVAAARGRIQSSFLHVATLVDTFIVRTAPICNKEVLEKIR